MKKTNKKLSISKTSPNLQPVKQNMCFPGGSVVKNPPANAGDRRSIPGPGRAPAEGNSKPLQYSCLGNPMDRGDRRATVRGVQRVRHDILTKQQQQNSSLLKHLCFACIVPKKGSILNYIPCSYRQNPVPNTLCIFAHEGLVPKCPMALCPPFK